jgi:hypothetical protein
VLEVSESGLLWRARRGPFGRACQLFNPEQGHEKARSAGSHGPRLEASLGCEHSPKSSPTSSALLLDAPRAPVCRRAKAATAAPQAVPDPRLPSDAMPRSPRSAATTAQLRVRQDGGAYFCCPSSTARTFLSNASGVIGFSRNAIPASRTP